MHNESAALFPPPVNPLQDEEVRAALSARAAKMREQHYLNDILSEIVVTDEASLDRFLSHFDAELRLFNEMVEAQARVVKALQAYWSPERRAELTAIHEQLLKNPLYVYTRELLLLRGNTGVSAADVAAVEGAEGLPTGAVKRTRDGGKIAIARTPDGVKVIGENGKLSDAPEWMKQMIAALDDGNGDDGDGSGTGGMPGGQWGGGLGNGSGGTLH